MKLFVAVSGSLFLLVIAAYCIFGFSTTFEPTDKAASFMAFRLGYIVIGLDSLMGAVFLIVNAVRK